MTSSSTASSTRVAFYASALHAFTTSTSQFRILHSVSAHARNTPRRTLSPPKNLYVLDSSFNPPTRAHLRIARSALLDDKHPNARQGSKRLLLLLATQNADKAPKPAAFEQRLVMMEIFARELLASLPPPTDNATGQGVQSSEDQENDRNNVQEGPESNGGDIQGVDIALTIHPYFAQKAASISEDAAFPSTSTTQIHLTGYDTLVRIFDPKYYPPSHTLEPLHPFLDTHRLRVTYRVDDSWGTREEQDAYLKDIGSGKREQEGAKKEWVEKGSIVLVEGKKDGEEVVSSTKVRQAITDGDDTLVLQLVTPEISKWIKTEQLYLDS